MAKSKVWNYNFFVGIDVSKSDLDIVLLHRDVFVKHFKIANEPYEIRLLIKEMKNEYGLTMPSTVFGMEHTGIYCNHLINTLEKLKANVVIDDARRIKASLGMVRGKNDKIDAIRIANYLVASRNGLQFYVFKRPLLNKLIRLTSLRSRLIAIQVALKTPLSEEKGFLEKSSSELNIQLCNSTLSALKNDIIELEAYIERCWKEDDSLTRLMTIVTSVKGIGNVTALQIILTTNEFRDFADARKFACYAGIAPFEYTSGSSVRYKSRVSNIANKKLKALLHACALTARTHDSEMKSYFLRKTQVEGKHVMSVMNAIRFKLVSRVFACVKQNRCFQTDYVSTASVHS